MIIPSIASGMAKLINHEDAEMKKPWIFSVILMAVIFNTGCTPEVGSEAWCKMMTEKPKGGWTANEAADYGKHCLFK